MNERLLDFRQRIFDPKKPLQTVLPIVLCAAIVAGIIYIASAIGVFTVREPVYRFDTGARLDYAGATTFDHDEESGVLTMKNHGKKETIDHAPVYFTNDPDRMLLPAQMIVVYPEIRRHGRGGFNMEITRTGGGSVATVRGNNIDVSGAFLFDGNNTYVFLEPMTVSLGMEEVVVPAYSYAYVYYGLRVELYSPDGSISVVAQTGDAIATAMPENRSYEIDLSKDILRTDAGEVLLITDPSVLDYVTAETGKQA